MVSYENIQLFRKIHDHRLHLSLIEKNSGANI